LPIANCIVTQKCHPGEHSIIDLWANESGQSQDFMTVNIVTGSEQFGNRYGVMATLFLPSLWSGTAISQLQLGLAKALAKKFNLSLNDVHVITSIVESGLVVESGKEEKW